jgi:Peptidase family S41
MFNIKYLLTVLLFISYIKTISAQNCTCTNSLNILQQKIEDNYAGFSDRVTSKSKSQYNELLIQLKRKAQKLNTGKECEALLKNYIDFFKDNHLYLENRYNTEKKDVQTKALPFDNSSTYFQQLPQPMNELCRIWKSDSYELAIVPAQTQGYFDAVVLNSKNENWKKGMVKMRLQNIKGNFYQIDYTTGDFEAFKTKAVLSKNILDILSVGLFEKTFPAVNDMIHAADYQSVFPDSDIKFTFPNDSTAVLFLGSFGNHYEALVDSLMLAYKNELEKRPYWIVDISYNGGGGTGTYKSLLPYLNTNGIKRSGSYYRLSKENVEKLELFLSANKALPPAVKSFFSTLITEGKKKPGSWYFEPGKTFNFSKVEPNPKQIGVLVSNNTASSGEIFVMDAKQSKKVTVFGSQTHGMVDYGDGFTYTIGCDSIIVSIPTRKSEYLKYVRYENIGLSPNVKIAQDEVMPYYFIMKYFEEQKRKQVTGNK